MRRGGIAKLAVATVLAMAFAIPPAATAADPRPPKGSGIPKDDDQGSRGEMLRAAKKKAEERFRSADANADGKLTREEAAAAGMGFVSDNFKEYDTDSDGSVSQEEFLSFKRKPPK